MKLKKVVKSLKKMNALVEQLKDQEEVSQLELDLLKEYTREFYKKIDRLGQSTYVVRETEESGDEQAATNQRMETGSSQKQQQNNPKYKYKIGQISDDSLKKEAKNLAEKVAHEQSEEDEIETKATEDIPSGQVEIPQSDIPVEDPSDQKKNSDVEKSQPPAEEKEEKNALDIPALELEVEDADAEADVQAKQPSSENKTETQQIETNKPETPAPEAQADPKPRIPKTYRELFEVEEGNDLSDKLSNAPIEDIRSSMGLNERVLTINELFGGNAMAFDKTVKALNQMDDFEDAKVFLSREIVPKYEWHEEGKLKKAKIFLKLVSRRYNS